MTDLKNVRPEITKDVADLGYPTKAVYIRQVSPSRYAVYVNGEKIGIYCMSKHTFVD